MGVWVVDPDWYFNTAAVLGQAASGLASAGAIVADDSTFALLRMAGDDPIGTSWGGTFDSAAKNTIDGVVALSRAWSALAGRVYQAGVNHAWAEFLAGRGRLPTPATLPHRPAISEPNLALRSSIGADRPGLTDILPGLIDAVGKTAPNANTDKLDTAVTSWERLAAAASHTVDTVSGIRAPDPSLPDARAFYATIAEVTAPGDQLAADALSLSGFSQALSTGVLAMRKQIELEVILTALALLGTASVAVGASYVTGGTSLRAEAYVIARLVRRAGNNIRSFIEELEATAALIHAFNPFFDAAMKAILDKNSLIAAEGFERNPDGTMKPTIRYFERAKWEAWQRYLARGGQWDIDRWSKAYDQLKDNYAAGYKFDRYVAEVMGYLDDPDWHKQYSDKDIVPGRRWDWAHVIGGRLLELVENKSGRLDPDQLRLDELALSRGRAVTYNINANYPYSAAEEAALLRLQRLYPGRFIVNRI